MTKKLLLTCLLILTMVALQGCGAKMSIEEAKKLSVSMEGSSFVPPPRRINDILEILDQPGVGDSSVIAKLKTTADSLPPKDASDGTLTKFYLDRGEAARQLGHYKKALDDLRISYDYAQKVGIPNASLLFKLGNLERACGNLKRAIELFHQCIKIGDNGAAYDQLVSIYLQLGDIESARKYKNEGLVSCDAFRAKNPQNIWPNVNSESMEASFLEAQGKFFEAERHWRSALEWIDSTTMERPLYVFLWRINLSNNLMKQGRYFESELEIRQALKIALGLGGKKSVLTGRAVGRLARVMISLNRLHDAEKLTNVVKQIYESIDITSDSNEQGRVRVLLADVFTETKNFISAAHQYDLLRKQMIKNKDDYDNNFSRNPNILLALLKSNRTEEAMQSISNAYNIQKKLYDDKHSSVAEIVGLRGMAKSALHQEKEALHDFATAVPILSKLEQKNIRVREILEAYLELLTKIRGTTLEKEQNINAVTEAFTVANALTALPTQLALAESSARAASSTDPELSDMVRKEQDLQKQITVLESKLSELLGAPTNEQDSGVMNKLRSTVDSLSQARATLRNEITKRFPKYADFTNPGAVTIELAQKILHPNEALISVYTTDDKTYTWTIPCKGEVKLSVTPLGTKEIGSIVTNLRKALDPNPDTFKDIPAFDVTKAYELYSKILKPTETGWQGASSLIVVANGPLAQLPLAVLPTEPVKLDNEKGELYSNYRNIPWLIRKTSISTLPSVNSLITLRTLPAGDPSRKAFVGFGDPAFNREQLAQITQENISKNIEHENRGGKIHVRSLRVTEKGALDNKEITSSQLSVLNRLPDTAEEIREVALAIGADPQKDIFLGKNASEHQVKTMNLADRKVISFATHALLPGDLDGLDQPALALSSPAVTGDKEDGLLTMGEIMKLKLNADWVVLSACNTGAAEGAGAEAVSGLGKAFFYAGTRALLVTMWPVETTSAKQLVKGTFQYLNKDKTLSRSGAIRESMLELIDKKQLTDNSTGKIVLSYAHPIFWAPFVMVGDPGQGGVENR